MPSSADTFLRRAARGCAWAGAALLAAALAAYVAFPWLTAALAPRLAPLAGLDVLELQVGRPGWGTLTVAGARAVSGRLEVRAEHATLRFDPGALLAGRLTSADIARLSVRVAEAGPAGSGDPPVTIQPPASDTWLAALPVRRMSVGTLRLAVPALEFQALGDLQLDGAALQLRLTGREPAAADGLALAARLSRDGRVDVTLTAPDAGSAFIDVTSSMAAAQDPGGRARLQMRGSLDLRGVTLALARSLAGLPAGDGRLTGSFQLATPWPLPPGPAWAMPRGDGTLRLDWRPQSGAWELDAMTITWDVADGRLEARASGALALAGQRFDLQGQLRDWVLPAAAGAGQFSVALPDDQPPLAQVRWQAEAPALQAEGFVEVGDSLLTRLATDAGIGAGEGRLRVGFEGKVPWPLPGGAPTLDNLDPQARGTLGASWQPADGAVRLHELDGRWQLEGQALAGSAAAVLGYRGLRADLELTLERLASGRPLAAAGSLVLGDAGSLAFTVDQAAGAAPRFTLGGRLDATGGLLEQVVRDWPGQFDATAGAITLDAAASWQNGGPVGSATVGLDDVSAYYEAYRIDGLASALRLEGTSGGWRLAPAPVSAERVNTGIVLHDLSSGVAWEGDVVELQATTFELLGGRARVEPFQYRLNPGAASFTVTLTDLALPQILALEGEQVSGTGTLDATLPIRIDDGRPRVVGGSAAARPPGGVLRVSEALAPGTGQPGLDFALRALRNFQYSVLRADVDYSAAGDLDLGVHLEGRNPEIEQGRPIHYNVNISENLPVLLESLRLQSDVTRQIERRLNN